MKPRPFTVGEQLLALKKKPVILTEAQKIVRSEEQNEWRNLLLKQISEAQIPTPEIECQFHPDRKYRADICWKPIKFIVEIDGGIWKDKAGHTTGTGYERDRIRDAEAMGLGFSTLRVTHGMIKRLEAIYYIKKLFKGFKDERDL